MDLLVNRVWQIEVISRTVFSSNKYSCAIEFLGLLVYFLFM